MRSRPPVAKVNGCQRRGKNGLWPCGCGPGEMVRSVRRGVGTVNGSRGLWRPVSAPPTNTHRLPRGGDWGSSGELGGGGGLTGLRWPWAGHVGGPDVGVARGRHEAQNRSRLTADPFGWKRCAGGAGLGAGGRVGGRGKGLGGWGGAGRGGAGRGGRAALGKT